MAGNQKVVLITGCSSGIGLKTAVRLANDEGKRFKVYATMRSLEKKGTLEKEAGDALNKTLFIEALEVTNDESINKAIDHIISKEGKVDVLVNNAGVGGGGPTEIQSNERIEQIFSTNVYGPMKLTRKLIPHWKKAQSGHVITVTSIAGLIGFPFSATYASSKFAMEGYMESLAMELYKYKGIKVSIVEPGPVTSHFAQNATIGAPTGVDEATAAEFQHVFKVIFDGFEGKWQQGEEIADVILEVITAKEPKLRYPTNPQYEEFIKSKYVDLNGDGVMKVAVESFKL